MDIHMETGQGHVPGNDMNLDIDTDMDMGNMGMDMDMDIHVPKSVSD
jgi:hypothetical protein